ncbi:hypothetical protein BIW11_07493 [Tropilaelaps mercedesae]|uniref:Uncharacterized protein n=1 Tax=Tropilaelaps mercedesae TaxID=418985 RepID=A0A1V9XTP0_9ACAR|nr:hypothetical protein BIW11_07493 [Tropilaelaps mercedesae]
MLRRVQEIVELRKRLREETLKLRSQKQKIHEMLDSPQHSGFLTLFNVAMAGVSPKWPGFQPSATRSSFRLSKVRIQYEGARRYERDREGAAGGRPSPSWEFYLRRIPSLKVGTKTKAYRFAQYLRKPTRPSELNTPPRHRSLEKGKLLEAATEESRGEKHVGEVSHAPRRSTWERIHPGAAILQPGWHGLLIVVPTSYIMLQTCTSHTLK